MPSNLNKFVKNTFKNELFITVAYIPLKSFTYNKGNRGMDTKNILPNIFQMNSNILLLGGSGWWRQHSFGQQGRLQVLNLKKNIVNLITILYKRFFFIRFKVEGYFVILGKCIKFLVPIDVYKYKPHNYT